ncbi:hypothetical protein [Mesorhizobium sp. M0088]|uniref:hypothetical protein n=1 Tax=Mesorhizobium sp. M0088 TaxID=2956873 RepID=UPI00333A631D
MNDKAGGRIRPLGCAVVPAGIMPRGFFAALIYRKKGRYTGKRENRRNQSHSSRRPDSFPAQAPMGCIWLSSPSIARGFMLQRSKTGLLNMKALLEP